MKSRAALLAGGFALFALIPTRRAYGYMAYVDPGSGLLLLQTVGAVAAAAVYAFRRKLASLFRLGRSEPEREKSAEIPPVVEASPK